MCRRLRSLVRNHSCWVLHEADGAILPPLSGLYHITIDPSGGWAGLKAALASCPEGGSALAKEGEYVYGPGDMEREGTRFASLLLDSPLHLFGHGKVTFKPADALPFAADWGIAPRTEACCVLGTSPRGTLDGLSIEAPRGTTFDQYKHGVVIVEGGLRLHSCQISVQKESTGHAVFAVGPATQPLVVGCQLSGGVYTVVFGEGAKGRLEGCHVGRSSLAGFYLWTPTTSPIVSGNSFRDGMWGVYIDRDVAAAWMLGPGNTFASINMIAGVGVTDRRPTLWGG